ncbi:hypothetical protein MASR1M32_11970 [Rhodobacter sp.]
MPCETITCSSARAAVTSASPQIIAPRAMPAIRNPRPAVIADTRADACVAARAAILSPFRRDPVIDHAKPGFAKGKGPESVRATL